MDADAGVNVAAVARRLLGVEPVGVRPTGSSVAYFVDLPGHTVVAKLPAAGRPGSALAEAWAYRAAADRGAQVPAVLGVSTEPECVLIVALTGTSLWSRVRPAGSEPGGWRRAGEDLRALHEIGVPGFGPLVAGTDGIRGESDAWCPFARDARAWGIRRLVDAGLLEPRHGGRLEERYDEVATLVHGCTDGRLLHGDLEGGHIFVADSGRYEGIIDFGQAQAGDPRWDLARVRLWDGDPALDHLLAGYGRDAVTAEDRELLLPLYLLAFTTPHLLRLVESGTDPHVGEYLERTGYRALL